MSKRYADCVSVRRGDVVFETGRVHAVVGENGAGKSTLLKMAAGLVVPDTGRVLVEGAPLTPHTASEALRRGVGMVQQHFALVPVFTVLENMVLGAEPGSPFGLALGRVRAAATRAFEQIGARVDLDARVEELGVGDRQRVEIARILFRGARTLILDEPTAVLTAREAALLYARLRVLAGAGCAVIVVTHKLDEVLSHADAVTVMRRGDVVESRPLRRSEPAAEARALTMSIMGAEPPPAPSPLPEPSSDVVLRASGLALGALRNVSFEVRAGEIVGLAGVEGNGQDELVGILGGVLTPDAGSFESPGGRPAVVFGDRQVEGLVLGASLEDNLLLGELGSFSRAGWLSPSAMRAEAERRRDLVGVVPTGLDKPAGELSGGNQQKVVVTRALARTSGASAARVLVLAHPTRGVDLGAARTIHDRVRDVVAARGVGVLVQSADLDELRSLCHRVLVISRGRIVADLPPATADVTFGEHMLGTERGAVSEPALEIEP